MTKQAILFLCALLLWGCTGATTEEAPLPPTPIPCLGFLVVGDLTCLESEGIHALVQSGISESQNLTLGDLIITLQGTAQITQTPDLITIRALEGSAVIGFNGRTRIIQAGSQLEIEVQNGEPQGIQTEPHPISDDSVGDLAVEALPRPIETPVPVQPSPTATSEAESTEEAEEIEIQPSTTIHATSNVICEPREDWGQTYVVEAGDVLDLIAKRFDTTILEIARANCLLNPGRLSIGQVLKIPGAAPTLTPSAIAFRADVTSVERGECTVLRWDIYNVEAVFIDDEATSNSDVLRVCPEETSTYTLRVLYRDQTETTRTLTITVDEP